VSTTQVRRLPLRGADLVLVAMQALWKHEGVSNNTLMVVQCDGPLDPARNRALRSNASSNSAHGRRRGLRRPFPWGPLHWAARSRATLAAPPVRHQRLAAPEALHAELEAELYTAIDPRREPPLRLSIFDCTSDCGGGRTAPSSSPGFIP